MAQPARIQQLTAALRASASRAASTTGGCALIFAILPDAADGSPKLRAAAGFSSPDEARGVSQDVQADVEDVVSSREPKTLAPIASLGERATRGGVVLPLLFEDRIHGALVVASPSAVDATSEPVLAQIASNAAVHLDHLRVLAELESVQAEPTPTESTAAGEDKSDELLKLSEELFAQDIQLLRSNEKLGKIEKLKNDFIEKMSLELRTPLNAIIEAIISVLAGENDAISDYAKASLRTALDEGTAFQRTLQNILDLWRIKQGELPTEIQDVNFTETVEETIFSVQETLDAKGIEIEKQVEEPMPKVLTDLGKVNQILFLLLENAAKFTEHGQITISARVEKETLHCSVADTGIGICPDDQQLIYDEFFQVDEFSSHRYRGAGLGLTLVRDLLVLLEGELHLESEPGHGTTVSFSIPVQLG